MSGKVIYPYGRLETVDLSLSSFIDEDRAVPLVNVEEPSSDLGTKRYGLVDAEPSWEKVNFRVQFRVDEALLGEVMPEPSKVDQEAAAILSVGCSATKFRQGYSLRRASAGLWEGELRLLRHNLRGIVQLSPLLVRTRAIAPTDNFAHFVGAILADGPGAEIAIDRTAPSPQGEFRYKYVDFSKVEDNTWLRSRADDVFYVDPRGTPTVFLNIRWPSLQIVLNNKSVRGVNAALRRTFGAVIGQDTWTQLLVTSVGSIVQDSDGTVRVAGEPWRADLAAKVGMALFPDADADQRLLNLYTGFRDPADVGMIVSQIGSIAHELTHTGKLLDQAAQHADNDQLQGLS